jgi:tetratricopeptide (TPR) repeat protein
MENLGFNSLTLEQKQILQAIAVYGQPTPFEAIAYILRDFQDEDQIEQTLPELVAQEWLLDEDEAFALNELKITHDELIAMIDVTAEAPKPRTGLGKIFKLGAKVEPEYSHRRLYELAVAIAKSELPPTYVPDYDDTLFTEYRVHVANHDFEMAVQHFTHVCVNYLLPITRPQKVIEYGLPLADKLKNEQHLLILLSALCNAYQLLYQANNVISLAQRGLAICETHSDPLPRLSFLTYLLHAHIHKRDRVQAEYYADEMGKLIKNIYDPLAHRRYFLDVAHLAFYKEDFAQSLEYCLRGNAIPPMPDIKYRVSLSTFAYKWQTTQEFRYDDLDAATITLAIQCYNELGQFEEGLSFAKKCLEKHTVTTTVNDILLGIGLLYTSMGNLTMAQDYYEQALVQDIPGNDRALVVLGGLLVEQGEYQEAIDLLLDGLTLVREYSQTLQEANTLANLGNAYLMRRDFVNAADYLKQAIAFADTRLLNVTQVYARWRLALLYAVQDDLASAHQWIVEALRYPQTQYHASILGCQGAILLLGKDIDSARHAFEKAIQKADQKLATLPQNYHALDGKALALCGLALISRDKESINKARTTFEQSQAIMQGQGYREAIALSLSLLKRVDSQGMLDNL